MNKREKILLAGFGVLFLVIVGGGLTTFAVKHYREVNAENAELEGRIATMTRDIAQGADWKGRAEFVEENIPVFNSLEEARGKLMEAVQERAKAAGVTISSREYIEQLKPAASLADEPAERPAFYNRTTVKLTLAEAQEKALFAWMFSLQEPKSFLGITRFMMSPAGKGKSVNCEVEITQFYREGQAPKLTKAN